MSAAENTKSILTEQVGDYRALLDIFQRERGFLLRFNARSVEALSKGNGALQ